MCIGALSLESESQLLNAYSPTDSKPAGNMTDVSESQSLNAYEPMDVTFFSSTVPNVDPMNAYVPIVLMSVDIDSEEALRRSPLPVDDIPGPNVTV